VPTIKARPCRQAGRSLRGTRRWFTYTDAYAPRRTVLDTILVEAAVEAGAELREHFSVQKLLTDGERVMGIRGHAVGVLDADGGRCRCMRAPNQIRREVMATYIVLLRWTQQGVEKVKESPARQDAAKQAAQAMGIEVKALYLVMGQYDQVAIAEAPDDETVAKLALATGAQGNIRTETMRAFTEEEMRKIIGSLP